MTELEFRQNEGLRAELRAVLSNSSLIQARQIILGKLFGLDAHVNSPEIASVRLLAQRTGYEHAFRDLEMLATPLPEPDPEPEHDYRNPDDK